MRDHNIRTWVPNHDGSFIAAQGEFISHNQTRLAASTISDYIAIFKRINTQLDDNPPLPHITPTHIDNWLTSYQHGPTANQYLSKMRRFFDWTIRMGYLEKNPCHPLDPRPVLKHNKDTKHRIPPQEWDTLLTATTHPLHRAIIACGLYLGARSSELRTIKLEHITWEHNQPLSVTVKRAKQNRIDTLPIATELAAEINQWLTTWTQHLGQQPPNDAYLLPHQTLNPHKPLAATTHNDYVRQALEACGYYKRGEGTHTLRRSTAAALYHQEIDSGYDQTLDLIRSMLGHAHTTTTENYIGTTHSQKRLEERLAGKPMFPTHNNVIPLKRTS